MLKVKITQKINAFIISLSGKCQMSNMTELEQAVAKVALKNPEIIYFNLKNVNYLDSYTITTFIRFVNSFSRDNVKINFYNISPEVESIFKISKVDLFFTILTPEQFDDSSFFTN